MFNQKTFNTMSDWVRSRLETQQSQALDETELQQTVTTLTHVLNEVDSTILIENLFPNHKLEVLCLNKLENNTKANHKNSFYNEHKASLSANVLNAIGHAISSEFIALDTDMVSYETDNAHVYVYKPEVKNIVLQATGVTLLAGH